MYRVVVAIVFCGFSLGQAFAASVTNADTSVQTIVVTEGSRKTELQVGAGETLEFCSSGCFVTFPNGDREALKGDETVEIKGDKASVK